MKKKKVFIIILVIIFFIGIFVFIFRDKIFWSPNYWGALGPDYTNNVPVVDKSMSPIKNKDQILGNKDDLISFSIAPMAKVHGVVYYRGEIKGAYFFEANIVINILDTNKKVLKNSNAMATTDWMTSGPVSFEGNIDFTGLPKGPAYFEIHNDNASGLPEYDKSILIPIIIE